MEVIVKFSLYLKNIDKFLSVKKKIPLCDYVTE